MTWHWSEPTPLDPAGAYTYEVEVTKNLGGEHQAVLVGTISVGASTTDVASLLENLLAPAVANGWVVSVQRMQRERHDSTLIYGG